MGATLALPLLDAMVPALSAVARTAARTTPRLACIYVPNGMLQERWTPSGEGTGFELSPILSSLESFRKDLLVVTGLAHRQAESLGDGNADHHRAAAAWLTGIHASTRNSGAREIRLGTSMDQVAARVIGQDTRLGSLELSLETPTSISCDSGADCFYSNTISWRTPTTPLPMETHPRVVFERLFGEGGTAAQRADRSRRAGSILDSVAEQAGRLERTLGPGDRAKLSEYLEAVRAIEHRVEQAEHSQSDVEMPLPERPTGIPATFEEHAKLLFDLEVLAFQADVTRVTTLMLARELSNRTYPAIGVSDGHHSVSHHQDNGDLIAKKAKIDAYHILLLGYFLDKLRSVPDGDGTLLDHTMVLYGSGLGDGNQHGHTNLPVLVAGGLLKGGRHLKYSETPMTNLLVTMLDKLGAPTDTLGDSTGRLPVVPLSGV
jgi:hypothetical protein